MVHPVSPSVEVSPPPEDPPELLAWATAHRVLARLDDVLIGPEGPPGTLLPSRGGEQLTYRDILLPEEGEPAPARRQRLLNAETARTYLHRIAMLVERHRAVRAFMDDHGRSPDDPTLAAFLAKLMDERRVLAARNEGGGRPLGTFEPVRVRTLREPSPTLRYEEQPLVGVRRTASGLPLELGVPLLGWQDGPLRWTLFAGEQALRGEISAAQRLSALAAMIDFLRDPDRGDEQAELAELLDMRAWQYALASLDERLARLDQGQAQSSRQASERIAYRVIPLEAGGLTVEPIVQRLTPRGGASRGARLEWFHMADRKDLGPHDRRVLAAYDDRLARRSRAWGGQLTAAQLFGILQALIDHPAVFLEGDRDESGRVDIRQGRLRLRFVRAADGALSPQFDLLGLPLLPADAREALRDDRYLVIVHRPQAAPAQILMAAVCPEAAALIQVLAVAPTRFPPEAHDALAGRLESLQRTVDIDFPSDWTRTITQADRRIVVRLELLASGAVGVEMGVRPVAFGPVFPPGDGPALVLEGQGRDRHGARRDPAAEHQAARALADRLGLGDETQPWRWRVPAGDLAFDLISTLQDLMYPPPDGERPTGEVVVEWADDERLLAIRSVGRRDLRLKVGDDQDWLTVQGGAHVEGAVVALSDLLVAIREGWRYVRVGQRGFARIEEGLRRALERAEPALFGDGDLLRQSPAAVASLLELIDEDSHLETSAAFGALRRRRLDAEVVTPALSPALSRQLRPYQRAGVEWLVRLGHWGAGAVLADEMGLGKTVQALAALYHRSALGPALVVAPTSLVANWADEAGRFVPELRVAVYHGPDRKRALTGLGPGDLLLTSYGVATLDAEELGQIQFGSLVLDEAQAIKNATTERARALCGLRADWRLGLTGTPIENAVGELWSLFRVLSPGLLGSWEHFRAVYAVPVEKFGDARRLAALSALLRPFVLRRTKADAAPELPERTTVVRPIGLSPEELALYEQLRTSLLAEIAAAKKDPERDAGDVLRFNLLAAITRLRQLCCHPRLVYPRTDAGSSKAAYLIDLLGELRQGGHRVLAFSQFRSFLDILAPRLRQAGIRVLTLDGTTTVQARAERVEAFQSGKADVFLISLKAGGTGLNLTAADTVIQLDPWWNPAVEDQAAARAHRIGQKRPVTAIRLVAEGTIEQAVLGLQAAKRALAAGVLEGTDLAAHLSTDELIALIRQGPPAPERDD